MARSRDLCAGMVLAFILAFDPRISATSPLFAVLSVAFCFGIFTTSLKRGYYTSFPFYLWLPHSHCDSLTDSAEKAACGVLLRWERHSFFCSCVERSGAR